MKSHVKDSIFRVALVAGFACSAPAFCAEIHDAVLADDLAKAQKLCNDNPELVHSRDSRGQTPLHVAALAGHAHVADLLLANGADVNAVDNEGATPLYMAAESYKDPREATSSGEMMPVIVNVGQWLAAHKEVADLLRQHGGQLRGADVAYKSGSVVGDGRGFARIFVGSSVAITGAKYYILDGAPGTALEYHIYSCGGSVKVPQAVDYRVEARRLYVRGKKGKEFACAILSSGHGFYGVYQHQESGHTGGSADDSF